jgi:hypothetical protein
LAEPAAQAQHAQRGSEAEAEIQMSAQQSVQDERLAVPALTAAPLAEAVHFAAAEMPVPVASAESTPVPEPAAPAVHAETIQPGTPMSVRFEEPASPALGINVEKALQESGLVMIQTDPTKVKPVEPVAEPQFVPAPPRPRRTPPPDTGPLQIVETKK